MLPNINGRNRRFSRLTNTCHSPPDNNLWSEVSPAVQLRPKVWGLASKYQSGECELETRARLHRGNAFLMHNLPTPDLCSLHESPATPLLPGPLS